MQKSVPFNKRGQYSEGFKLLNKAVDIAPVENLGYRGYIKLYMHHDFNGAITDFLRLDLLTPNVADAPWGEDIYHVIGLAYKELGELDSAQKYFNKSIIEKTNLLGEEWVDVKTFLYFGIVEYELGNYLEAIELFDKALSYSKTFTEAYYYIALANKKINKPIESCNDLDSSYLYFNKGYYMSNPYYELPNQIYLSTITNSMDSVCLIR
jgi:tetratricopeptide (TPR) repeat protein